MNTFFEMKSMARQEGRAQAGPATAETCGDSRYRFYIEYRQSPFGPVDPSFRALSGRLKFTVRRHKFNEDSLLPGPAQAQARRGCTHGGCAGSNKKNELCGSSRFEQQRKREVKLGGTLWRVAGDS